MTDQNLRDLARRAEATGSIEDEAALLLARVRAGDLAPDQLTLAAYCGHEAARRLLGEEAPTAPDVHQREGLLRWAMGLRRWGREACVRAAVGAAEVVQPLWERACPGRGEPALALQAARAWLTCPCSDHARQAEGRGEQAWEIGDEVAASRGATMAARAASAAASETAREWSEHDGGGMLLVALLTVRTAKGKGRKGAAAAIEAANRELIAWALSPRV